MFTNSLPWNARAFVLVPQSRVVIRKVIPENIAIGGFQSDKAWHMLKIRTGNHASWQGYKEWKQYVATL